MSRLAATPLRFHEYLASKVVILLSLSVVLAVFVATATHGLDYRLPTLLAGTALGTLVMLLAGLCAALPFRSVSDWFLPSTAPLAVLTLPVFHYSGVWETPWLYLVPTQGPLLLLGAAFEQKALSAWQSGYSVAYPRAVRGRAVGAGPAPVRPVRGVQDGRFVRCHMRRHARPTRSRCSGETTCAACSGSRC